MQQIIDDIVQVIITLHTELNEAVVGQKSLRDIEVITDKIKKLNAMLEIAEED